MFVCLSVCLSVCLPVNFFFCQRFLSKPATYWLSVPLFVHFSLSPVEIFVTDFSAPIGASVFNFFVHLQVGKLYCLNENKDANPYFAYFFLIFHFFLLSLL